MEPEYESFHCRYSTAPCVDCPFVKCVHDYHDGKHTFIARERRKILRELRLKGVSVAMLAGVFGQTNQWVRDKIRGK